MLAAGCDCGNNIFNVLSVIPVGEPYKYDNFRTVTIIAGGKKRNGGTATADINISAADNKTLSEMISSKFDPSSECLGTCNIPPHVKVLLKKYESARCKTLACQVKTAISTAPQTTAAPIKKDLFRLNDQLKKSGPTDTQWLSDLHIGNVMTALEAAYGKFKSLPVEMASYEVRPISIDNFMPGMVADIANKDVLRRIFIPGSCCAVVLNTDHYPGSGIHWVCLFADFRGETATIEFFNSCVTVPREFRKLSLFWAEVAKECGFANVEIINVVKTELQKDQSECGVYSCIYIIGRAYCNLPISAFDGKNKLPFREINAFRSKMLFAN
jgi:hypothetical protein